MGETDTTTSTGVRDAADLDAEVAVSRGWASQLHAEATRRMEAESSPGVARDEAAADAWALRQKAKAADVQAAREHREATKWESLAAEQEASAADLQQAGRSAEAQEAREDADGMRARARSSTERAKEAERRAQEATDEAEPLEERVRKDDAQPSFDRTPAQIERVADQLDDKVRLLEEAGAARQEALRLRDAGDQAKAVEAAQRAVDAQAAADAIAPEYHLLDADVRAATGIDDGEIEMDPEVMRPDGQGSTEPPEIEMDPEVMRPDGQGSTEAPEIEMDPEVMRPADEPGAGAPTDGETEPEIDPAVAAELAKDSDRDGITDFLELRLGTKPDDFDSDGDGLTDGYEDTWRHTGIDPLVADGDNDGSNDGEELAQGSDPTNVNTDGDQYRDGDDLLPIDPTNTLGGPRSPAPTPTPEPDATSGADPMPAEEMQDAAQAADLGADLTEDPSDSWSSDDTSGAWPADEPSSEPEADEPTLEYDT